MRLRRLVLAIGCLAAWETVVLAAATEDAAPLWMTDYAAAEVRAKQLQRPLLVHFHARWCGPCRKMDREVFSDLELQEKLRTSFVAVKVDSDRNTELARRLGVYSLPMDVVIDPISGGVLGQSDGFQNASAYLSMIARLENRFRQTHKLMIARVETPPEDHEPEPASDNPSPVPAEKKVYDPQSERLLGLEGFCPVSLLKTRKWVKGTAEYSWTHKGIDYRMVGTTEWEQFKSAPDRYAPRLLGCDPIVLWETDRAVTGSVRFGAYYDDQLYLFATAENRRRFKENPPRYTRTQHVLRVEEISGTRFR